MESKVSGDIVEYLESTSHNVYITGKAGTGKSVQLKRFVERNGDRCLVVAPTGIAAINCGGSTIHKMFALPITTIQDHEIPGIARRASEAVAAASTIVCDEVGMVRADMWHVIDHVMRLVRNRPGEPFGGARIICFGDLYQLPPIVRREEAAYFDEQFGTPYFFSAPCMKDYPFEVIELSRVFRQKDHEFIDILNKARVGEIQNEDIQVLNTRFRPDFESADGYVTLCTRNAQAEEVNSARLKSLPGELKTYTASIPDGLSESGFPNDAKVTLKAGCQVMVVKNTYIDGKKMIPNGAVGIVKSLKDESVTITIDGCDREIIRARWELFKPRLTRGGRLESVSNGAFEQIPLKLGYACTIHKSQGVTLDRAIIDLGSGAFAEGQTYVALSRCRSLDGIILKSKIALSDIFADGRLNTFMEDTMKSGSYLRFEQDIIDSIDSGCQDSVDPIKTLTEGNRTGAFLTSDELSLLQDVMRGGVEDDVCKAASLSVQRMIDEIIHLRTKVADLSTVVEDLNRKVPAPATAIGVKSVATDKPVAPKGRSRNKRRKNRSK